jgi:two-component sensor histidine kinase
MVSSLAQLKQVEKASEEAQEAARKLQSDVAALAAALGLNAA